jgi:hypothetical protein
MFLQRSNPTRARLAISDEEGKIAFPLEVIENVGDEELLDSIQKNYFGDTSWSYYEGGKKLFKTEPK